MSQKEESQPADVNVELSDAAMQAQQAEAGQAEASKDQDETQPPGNNTPAQLEQALSAAERKAENYYSELLRARAELENFRKRAERDVENAHKFALERFLGDLLPVSDSLELGMSAAEQATEIGSVREGMGLTLKLLAELLQKNGVESVNPLDEKFNPELHQAMSIQEAAGKDPGTVLIVLQKGYVLNGRLLRPAMVIVAK